MFLRLNFTKNMLYYRSGKNEKDKDMENLIIETCVNCNQGNLVLEKIKHPKKAEIYFDACYKCKYEHEIMILSGNCETLLPIELKNIYEIFEQIKNNKFHFVAENYGKFYFHKNTSNKKMSTCQKYQMIFSFIVYLRKSDSIKPLVGRLEKEMSKCFLKDLTDKRKCL